MSVRLVAALSLYAASSAAFAAADLTASLSGPAAVNVGAIGRYTVTVNNIGNANTTTGSVVIQLPETSTTPIYTMGTVNAKSSVCTQSGTVLTCNIGGLRRGKSTSVYVDMTLPESADPIVFDAVVSTTNSENSTANNSASYTANPLNVPVSSFTGAATVSNSHCTGTSLSAYYECTLFPSSIATHTTVFNADHTITFPGYPDYAGTWATSGNDLTFTYTHLGAVSAEFSGSGITTRCWDGLTTFPGSTYVSPYRVCVP